MLASTFQGTVHVGNLAPVFDAARDLASATWLANGVGRTECSQQATTLQAPAPDRNALNIEPQAQLLCYDRAMETFDCVVVGAGECQCRSV